MRKAILCAFATSLSSVYLLHAQTATDTIVTTTTQQTITGVKTFNPTLTPAGSYTSGALFTSNYNLTGNSNIIATVRFNAPTINNPGNYTYATYAVLVKGPMLVEDYLSMNEVRTNQIRWKTASTINVLKAPENTSTLMAIKTMSMLKTTSTVNNGLLLQDSVTFNSNTIAAGFNTLHVNPLLTQTGYTGATRGIYINPSLTGVTDFRAIQTEVASGNGYQVYAAGTAPSYFRGRVFIGDSISTVSSSYLILNTNRAANGTGQLQVGKSEHAGAITIVNSAGAPYGMVGYKDGVTASDFYVASAGDNGKLFFATGGTDRMIITNSGSVGIGTSVTGNYKLAVEGTIGARRVKVTSAPWADYVFDSAYQLKPLAQVEQFIRQNKHLPDVPTAATVANEGVDIGDIQALLLKKIEELTLYIIEQNKQLEAQGKELEEQSRRIGTLLQKKQ